MVGGPSLLDFLLLFEVLLQTMVQEIYLCFSFGYHTRGKPRFRVKVHGMVKRMGIQDVHRGEGEGGESEWSLRAPHLFPMFEVRDRPSVRPSQTSK